MTRFVHRVASLEHESHTVIETERTVGGECGVLAETVTSAHARLDTKTFDGVEHHEAAHEGGELRVASVFEFVRVSLEQQPSNVATGDGRRLVDEFPTLVADPRATHAGTLRALTREQEREQRSDLLVSA
jgi:hypothetical protein